MTSRDPVRGCGHTCGTCVALGKGWLNLQTLAGYPHAPRSNSILHTRYESDHKQAVKQDEGAKQKGQKPRALQRLLKQLHKSEKAADISEG